MHPFLETLGEGLHGAARGGAIRGAVEFRAIGGSGADQVDSNDVTGAGGAACAIGFHEILQAGRSSFHPFLFRIFLQPRGRSGEIFFGFSFGFGLLALLDVGLNFLHNRLHISGRDLGHFVLHCSAHGIGQNVSVDLDA